MSRSCLRYKGASEERYPLNKMLCTTTLSQVSLLDKVAQGRAQGGTLTLFSLIVMGRVERNAWFANHELCEWDDS